MVGVYESTGVVSVLLTHFSGALDASDTARVSVQLCGLKTTSSPPDRASVVPIADGNKLVATTWVVSDTHNTYWAAWRRDVARAMAEKNLTWPADVSQYDETAPATLLGRKGWEWVDRQWPRYRSMTQLRPNATDVAVEVSDRGCATLELEMEPHSVVLYEIARPGLQG